MNDTIPAYHWPKIFCSALLSLSRTQAAAHSSLNRHKSTTDGRMANLIVAATITVCLERDHGQLHGANLWTIVRRDDTIPCDLPPFAVQATDTQWLYVTDDREQDTNH